MKIFGFHIFKKGQIDASFRTSSLKLKFFQKISRVGYVCIEESFDTIFNMACGGSVQRPPAPMAYGSRKSAMAERVKLEGNKAFVAGPL